jgi:hypothetical protein
MSETSTISKKLRRLAVIGAAIATCTASLAVGTATAATPHSELVRIPMKVVGFDAALAAKNGYQIKRTATGQEYSVKAGAANAVAPQNQVNTSCGVAWIFVYGLAPVRVQISTGFQTNIPAQSFSWQIYLSDNGGISNHTWSGGLNNVTQWHVTPEYGGMTAGPVHGWVNAGSNAKLANGAVCDSGGPESYSTIPS